MKTYLLYNGIASRNKLNNLRKSVRNITEIGEEMTANSFKESFSLIPDRLQLSIRSVFPSINLSNMSRNPQGTETSRKK